MRFRGRTIYDRNGYPSVYWPEHPVASVNGLATIHRIVAYEMWGNEIASKVVHHEDHDRWNWNKSNLKLKTNSEHITEHRKEETIKCIRACDTCGLELAIGSKRRANKDKFYCSDKCFKKGSEKTGWPSIEELVEMVRESSYTAVGKALGVSDTAVRKRIKNERRQFRDSINERVYHEVSQNSQYL